MTAVAIASALGNPTAVLEASSVSSADALSAWPEPRSEKHTAAAGPGSVSLPTAVSGYLQKHADTIASATTFGGVRAVSDSVVKQMQVATP